MQNLIEAPYPRLFEPLDLVSTVYIRITNVPPELLYYAHFLEYP